MITLIPEGGYLINGNTIIPDDKDAGAKLAQLLGENIPSQEDAKKETIAYQILESHNKSGNMHKLQLSFDKMASHDITYVGIIQTARGSGLTRFPMPYVLTNCHNSLCAVGGTINEDDHLFGLSAAKKYGGIYVPAHQAVIHQYMREMESSVGKMILGSDSHTRYGALGTMAIGEGGPELVKQLLGKTYDINCPEVIGVHLTGKPIPGVGPQDVALAIIGAVFQNGFVKNKVMEFFGEGVGNLTVDFRNGIDVMTTETTCLSSVWMTDGAVKGWYTAHGRVGDFAYQAPGQVAYYHGFIQVELDKVRPMIAMPFHPSNVYTIDELNHNLLDILEEIEKKGQEQLETDMVQFSLRDKVHGGKLYVEQGVVAGCAGGTYENIMAVGDIMRNHSVGNGDFAMSVYPASQPVFVTLAEKGVITDLMIAGATVRSAFCGPCFGAGDVPANGSLSVRHSTRNFPNREGSKITGGQIASVALMDARSIAATAINGGRLTSACDLDMNYSPLDYTFHEEVYKNRCYFGFSKAEEQKELRFGPNITDWPAMEPLAEDMLLKVVTVIHDPVTTTDELIPSGETSSYRSNPLGLAEFTLSRKDPAYVGHAKEVQALEKQRLSGVLPTELSGVYEKIQEKFADVNLEGIGIGSTIYAKKPGDGSAREQAASCQKVLGGYANLAGEYATKRYRSNLINWGMLPFVVDGEIPFGKEDYIFIPNLRQGVAEGKEQFTAYIVGKDMETFELSIGEITPDERKILLAGCLMNFYRG